MKTGKEKTSNALCGTARLFLILFKTKFLLELIHSAACIDKFLLAGKERVALRADIYAQLFFGRTGGEGFTARALNGCFNIIRMDSCLHVYHSYS